MLYSITDKKPIFDNLSSPMAAPGCLPLDNKNKNKANTPKTVKVSYQNPAIIKPK
jgi:hypothetical protein